ncbi:MAG: BamA/TamA family outer membrane protein, partial [Candidatus Paceibacterota bacterium]
LVLLIYTGEVYSQDDSMGGESDIDPISADRIGSFYSILPIVGYSSDWGVYGGGFIQRINYGVGVEPFLSNLKTDITVSTKGYFVSQIEYERTKTFGMNLRSRIEFIGQRITRGQYFGIGNDTEFSKSLYDEGFYFYENRELYLKYIVRKQVGEFSEFGKIDLFATSTFWRVNSITRGNESLFSNDEPPGFQTSSIGKIGIGTLLDSRDDEFSPTGGIQYEAGLNIAPSLFGFDYSYSEAVIDLRQYVTLFSEVVFANRVKYNHTFGDAPFWAMPIIGNNDGLRGYYFNRFRGDSSILSMTEVRAWLFSVWDDQIRIGSHLFWDTGRVYTDFDSNAFFDEWKHSIGFGFAFTLFHPDFILRSDFGFSNEAFRFYFGTGYVF